MRKGTKIISLLIALIILSGCRPSQALSSTPTTMAITETRELTASAMTFAEFFPGKITEFQEAHYTDEPLVGEPLQYAQSYINTVSAAEGSEDSFVAAFRGATRVDTYPIFGTNLETTDLIAYLFYTQDQPTSIGMLRIDQTNSAVEYYDYTEISMIPTVVEPHSIHACFLTLTDTLERYPNFEILGLAYDTHGYPAIYPIGKNESETTIKFISGEPKSFFCVEPFSTIEDGREALGQYMERREQIWSEITVYPWSETELYSTGYLNVFVNTVDYKTTYPTMDFSYLDVYDSVVSIPLLDGNLQENVYVLHLLYYRNQLIGELVIQRVPDGNDFTYIPVWENAAEKDADGKYISITQSQYVSSLSNAQTYSLTWDDKGVVFDGHFKPIGYEQDLLMYFDPVPNVLVCIE